MPRLTIAVVALSALFFVTGCGNTDGDSTSKPGAATAAPMSEDRFETLWSDSITILGSLNEITTSGDVPADATEANEMLELADADLRLAEYTADEKKGSGMLCLINDSTSTFLSLDADKTFSFYMGDGTECSYEADAAEVVGDLSTEKWTKGATFMGEGKVADLYATQSTPTPME